MVDRYAGCGTGDTDAYRIAGWRGCKIKSVSGKRSHHVIGYPDIGIGKAGGNINSLWPPSIDSRVGQVGNLISFDYGATGARGEPDTPVRFVVGSIKITDDITRNRSTGSTLHIDPYKADRIGARS